MSKQKGISIRINPNSSEIMLLSELQPASKRVRKRVDLTSSKMLIQLVSLSTTNTTLTHTPTILHILHHTHTHTHTHTHINYTTHPTSHTHTSPHHTHRRAQTNAYAII